MTMFMDTKGHVFDVNTELITHPDNNKNESLGDKIYDALQDPKVGVPAGIMADGAVGSAVLGAQVASLDGLAAGATAAGAALGVVAVGAGLAYEAIKHKKEVEEAGKKIENTAEHVIESAKNFIENHL